MARQDTLEGLDEQESSGQYFREAWAELFGEDEQEQTPDHPLLAAPEGPASNLESSSVPVGAQPVSGQAEAAIDQQSVEEQPPVAESDPPVYITNLYEAVFALRRARTGNYDEIVQQLNEHAINLEPVVDVRQAAFDRADAATRQRAVARPHVLVDDEEQYALVVIRMALRDLREELRRDDRTRAVAETLEALRSAMRGG